MVNNLNRPNLLPVIVIISEDLLIQGILRQINILKEDTERLRRINDRFRFLCE